MNDTNNITPWLPQEPLDSTNESCRNFVGRLNESLAVWGDRLPVEAR